ncbi:MAG: Mrp/NBP35 family ATP-binding protein [Clostridia bacterium]
MKECDHNCDSCSVECEENENKEEKIPYEKTHELSNIKKVFGVVSGKGGVGKSLVTSLLASMSAKQGKKTAILDADITGPSIPKMFGIKGNCTGDEYGIFPKVTCHGIKIMSANLMLENENDPVLWRGPLIAGMVSQFWTDVIWGDVDYMFVDMPPGTGDVALTVFQSIKIDGIIVVTTPQDLVSMIVEKAVKMANMMNIPIVGIVENMSYLKCPCCNEQIEVFGKSKASEVASNFGLSVLSKIPINSEMAKACDEGNIESINADFLIETINAIMKY